MTMLESETSWARDWLFNAALPLWWQVGADPAGGYYDKIHLDGTPLESARRLRVQARQTYVYVEAGRLGWPGPWREAALHGLHFMKAFLRQDGLFRMRVAPDGSPVDDGTDLYDQAFAQFALAHLHMAGIEPRLSLDLARANAARLRADLTHPLGGFEEAHPRVLPLRSNPHMHLLEACLAWVDAGVSAPFEAIARELVELATSRLIDPETGAIGEFYDGNWCFESGTPGTAREPGHQFEWAYLLHLTSRKFGLDFQTEAERLYAFGTRFGIDPARKAATFTVDAAGAMVEPRARLWAQTERLRTALVFAQAASDPQQRSAYEADARDAFEALRAYLDVSVPGLWHDQWLPDGSFLEEAAPASSFYHIVTAFAVLLNPPGADGAPRDATVSVPA